MDWLKDLPPWVQVAVLIGSNALTALIGARAGNRDATSRAVATMSDAYSQALKDMQTRLDHFHGEVERCERERAADRIEHAKELATVRDTHNREVGELRGQIGVLERMVRGGNRDAGAGR